MSPAPTFPALLEAFFVDRLIRQRQSSPHTIASYRDAFRLLLHHAQQTLRKAPSDLAITDLDTPFLSAFFDHIEKERDNSARSRNVRLAAIHSFFRYVALHAPEHSALAQRVLAMPSKRYVRRPIAFLTSVEVTALLAAPDLNSWGGRRDRALLTLAVQTGLRAADSSAFVAMISCSARRLMFNAMARGARFETPLFARIRLPFYVDG
jgi:site-specific recombinase XerD